MFNEDLAYPFRTEDSTLADYGTQKNELYFSPAPQKYEQVMVPLAFLRKDRLRQFDVTSDGETIPILGAAENALLATEMLLVILERAGVQANPEMRTVAAAIAGPESVESQGVRHFMESGYWNDELIVPSKILSQKEFQWILKNFAQNFLLIGILPASQLRRRLLIKMSFHWNNEPDISKVKWHERLFGFRPVEFEIDMLMSAETSSYHFEFQTPPELECVELSIPQSQPTSSSEQTLGTYLDESRNPVAHVHEQYEGPGERRARVAVTLPLRGLRTVAATSLFTAAVIFLLAISLPNAMQNLTSANGSAATLLVTIPAAFIGFFVVSNKESALVASLRRPILLMMLVSVWSLLGMAASIAGSMEPGLIWWFWFACFLVNLVMLGAVLTPVFINTKRGKHG